MSVLFVPIFQFKFIMLHHMQASQEGFNIKWSQGFRACPKSEKQVQKISPPLKSRLKCGQNVFF
jgi:hypothetical protein